MLSIVLFQPVFAETTHLKQWIAPAECVIEGNILTPEECDQLLHPEPPVINPPGSSSTNSHFQPTARYEQITLLMTPFAIPSPSPVDGSGVKIVDRSETRSTEGEYFLTNLIVLSFILIGAGFVAFTARRATASLSKEDRFDKMYRRVSSFWTRKAK